ncbi:hypothetical protein TSUD_91160 [Trifolium subterraneum]|uniref:TF-B3 domain-containing protein n=1 Tax=Trifolium subterraneum TaxID=3900 RepID=A0A2Z6P0Q5_TRISU|nr:hypothetical protein TSUD_91160 [Trifolium subterraneum]
MTSIKERDVIDVSSGDEAEDSFDVPHDDNYVLHEYESDRLFGWKMIHFPPRTANSVVRDMKNIIIRTQQNLDGTRCTIKKYTRKGGKKDMYMTEGCYEFKKANELKEGDKLEFQLSNPPDVVVVDIVRGNN